MKNQLNPFERALAKENLRPIEAAPTVPGQQANDAKPENLAHSMAMAEAARAVVDHPAWDPRDREIWRQYVNSSEGEEVAFNCTTEKLKAVIERGKHLMLHPDEEPDVDPIGDLASVLDEDVNIDTPPDHELPPDLSFQAIEDSLALSAKTAHRVILHVSNQRVLKSAELKALESATRSLVLLRRSELEYLNKDPRRRKGHKATAEELNAIAAKNKVKE